LEDDCIHRNESPKPTWNLQDEDDLEFETDINDGKLPTEENGELPATYKRMMGDIGLFRNLRRIELVYDYTVEGLTERSWTDAREDFEYRDIFFRKLLSAVNHSEHPASKLNSLSIQNLQDCVNADTATSTDFMSLISLLDELELLVLSEEKGDEYEIRIQERHDFYSGQLRRYWLQPLSEVGRLTSLKLYGSISWGYLPKCDLRGLHFPKLKSLDLGNMTFTHEWQLDWIVSHGSSLERLSLKNCPIIPDFELTWRIDTDGYPVLPTPYPGTSRGRRVAGRSKYESRWHDYFRNFRSKLPQLRHFAVTHGRWMQGNEGPSTALKVFNAAETWPTEIRAARYCKMTGYDLRTMRMKSIADMFVVSSRD
jgi:hypothetical protein